MQDRWHTRKVEELEQRLRAALRQVLEQPAAESLLPLRVEAGTALGALGDPRVPVTADQWSAELSRRNEVFGQPAGYWCYVREGTYRVGGWHKAQAVADLQLPTCWFARFPVTVAQYAPFVDAGYKAAAERWWTPEGWKWKQSAGRTEPWGWSRASFTGSNRPVIGVTWYEATAFCAWLTAQARGALPAGYLLRLPTEAEWEAAAAYDAQMQRWPYPWGDAEPTPERAIYNASGLGQPALVGCCPSGAAACGALDVAGNVWEVMASSYRAYPTESAQVKEDFTGDDADVAWRRGSYWEDSTYVRCGARVRYPPDDVGLNVGFRVVLAPALAQRF